MKTNNRLVTTLLMFPSFFIYPSLVHVGRSLEVKSVNRLANKTTQDCHLQNSVACAQLQSELDLAVAQANSSNLDILGTQFSSLSYENLLYLFQAWIDAKVVRQVCIANVHSVVTALTDSELRSICNNALTTMDGQPLVWYANLVLNKPIKNRVCGPDLMMKCLDEGRAQGWKHYFLGGKDYVLQDLVDTVQTEYPGINIVGWHSPPFRSLTSEEDQRLMDDINAAQPDFLWVCLGAPKQEKWIAEHLPKLQVPIQIGVGAAFSFISGHVERAPRWMQKSGLEWLYRMSKEKRLVGRYLKTNPVFLLLFFKDLLFKRMLKLSVATN